MVLAQAGQHTIAALEQAALLGQSSHSLVVTAVVHV
jgi:hypothetical protein